MAELRVLELFCGLGGLRLGLEQALDALGDHRPRRFTAVDASPTAAACYEANFPGETCLRKNVESLPASAFEAHDAWIMSPPCQPFTATANAKQRDVEDPRCAALKRVCEVLPTLSAPPRHVLLENVAPFAASRARRLVEAALSRAGYTWRCFLLDPPAITGTPAHRRRFYLAAERSARFAGDAGGRVRVSVDGADEARTPLPAHPRRPVADFVAPASEVPADAWISKATLAKPWARGLSYVGDRDTRLFCFTSGYGKVVHKASGSLYLAGATAPLASEAGRVDRGDLARLAGRVRRFTPSEVLNFLDFPKAYEFPDAVDRRRRYKAAGASVNVAVVRRLCESLFSRQ
jgi:site-specific DNA-cytosine methylase